MEKSNTTELERPSIGPAIAPPVLRPRKRFGVMSALVRFALAVIVVGAALFQTMAWISNRPQPPQRMDRERTFTVEAIVPQYGTHRSDIRTFGEVTSARTIDLRAQVQGRVASVAEGLAVGSTVSRGDILATIDSFAYEGAVVAARAALADAEISLAEAQRAYELEQSNIASAETALQAAQTDLERAQSLLRSGSVTQQTVDARELTVSEREGVLRERRANLFTLEAQILRQQAAIEQAQYNLDTARRDLENTTIEAPFDGVITERNVTTGGYISTNEVVASLYESSALEVRFTLSDREYGILREDGLAGRAVEVTWTAGPRPVNVSGQITRTAAQVDAATGGVTLFASLDPTEAAALRPGTFVSVAVEGIAHEESLRVPEVAVYDDDHLYVVRDGRMAPVDLEILDRDGAHLIVSADIPEGERIITTRLSQAGEGVAVEVEGDEPDATGGGRGGGPGQGVVMRGPGGGGGGAVVRGPGG